MKPLRKICGIPFPLAILLAMALMYACIFAGPTRWVLRAKRESASNPALWIVPIPLSDTSISAAPGTKVISFGYQFEVPWQSEVKIREDAFAVAPSQSGDEIAGFMNPAKFEGPIKTLRQELGSQFNSFGAFYGPQNIQSDYDALRATLYASPAQLSLFFPWSKQVYSATLLMLKGASTKEMEKGLYALEIGGLRGFQFGDPTRAKNIRVEVFDKDDQRLSLFFGSKSATSPALTQAEINRVLQTFRPTTDVKR
jgi:hypothetical protein